MNIQVRVLSARAQSEIRALQAQVAMLQRQLAAAGAGAGAGGFLGSADASRSLQKMGSSIQWAGRQLSYNFTAPIALAGYAATKFALDNEAAMTRVTKVYGDGTMSAEQLKNETTALTGAFEALSNKFGVQQSEVMEIAGAWAAAGSSGLALAKSVELTLSAMILGQMDAAESTEALIAIQAQYGVNTAGLTNILAQLNVVENQTGISLKGLVEGFQRAAGVARSAGVDSRHLAAMLAAITPAAGTAAQAGNSLKTIISRLASPTREATEVLGLMGINTADIGWQSSNAAQKIEIMAKKFSGLNDAQKAVVSKTAAGVYQINRFSQLMADINNPLGYYQKALKATADESQYFAQAQRELNTVLESNPQRLKIMWTILQNAMADVIQPMLPMLVMLASVVASAAQQFANVDPAIQKMVVGLLIAIALVGPISAMVGSAMTLFGLIGRGFGLFGSGAARAGSAMLWLLKLPFSAALVAASGVVGFLINLVPRVGLGIVAIRALYGSVVAYSLLAVAGMGRWSAAAIAVYRRSMIVMGLIGGLIVTAMRIAMVTGISSMARMGPLFTRIGVMLGLAFTGGFAVVQALFTRFGPALLAGLRGLIPMAARLGRLVVLAFTGPWGWAIAAVLVVIYSFRNQIKQVWDGLVAWFRGGAGVQGAFAPVVAFFHRAVDSIRSAFHRLPAGVQTAMLAVWNVVKKIAMAIYRALQYINPFASHSPSLVSSVTAGMDEITRQFTRLDSVRPVIDRAYRDIQRLSEAAEGFGLESFDDFAKVKESMPPDVVAAYSQLSANLRVLRPLMRQLATEVAEQERVVEDWSRALDRANDRIDEAQKALDRLEKQLSSIQGELDAANAELDRFVSAPIAGMGAMEDAIFSNEMAQKRLRLEIMRLEDATGPVDDLEGKLSSLQGEIELLRGKQAELREMGAGSDILSTYDAQIVALQAQQDAIEGQAAPLQQMQQELDELGRKAEMLDLEKSLAFDPLTRQIEKMTSAAEEMPFDQIVSGIQRQQAEVARLQQSYDSVNVAMNQQKGIVDQLTLQRDAIQAQYDTESAKLGELKEAYDGVETAVRDVEAALNDMVSRADRVRQKMEEAASAQKAAMESSSAMGGAAARADALSPGAQNFMTAQGDFPEVGGMEQIGREGGPGDQSAAIENYTKGLAAGTADMLKGIDPFSPIRRGWNSTMEWLKGAVPGGMGSIDWGGGLGNFMAKIKPFTDTLADMGRTGVFWLKAIWALFGPEVKQLLDTIWQALKKIWVEVGPEVAKFKELLKPLMHEFKSLWEILKPLVAIIGVVLLGAIKIIVSIFNDALGPALDMIIGIVSNVIQAIRGFVFIIAGLLTGDWAMAWQGAKDLVAGTFGAIWALVSGVVMTVVGIIKGFVTGIVDFFVWLYEMIVGHSIIPDMINGIISWFVSLPGRAIAAIIGFAMMLWNWAKDSWDSAISSMKERYGILIAWIFGIPGWIRDGLAALIGFLIEWGKASWDRALEGMKDRYGILWAWVKGLPQSIRDGLGDLGNLLKDAGKRLIEGLWNGIKDMDAWIDKKIREIGQWIKEAFYKVFGIGSPSKMTGVMGNFLMTGLVGGMLAKLGLVRTAAEQVGDTVSTALENSLQLPSLDLKTVIPQGRVAAPTITPPSAPMVPTIPTQNFDALGASTQALTNVGLAGLARELQDNTMPALTRLQENVGTGAVAAVNALAATLAPLTEGTQLTGKIMREEWDASTTTVAASQIKQSAHHALLDANLKLATASMTLDTKNLEIASLASWATMQAVEGQQIATITGVHFPTLDRGLQAVQDKTGQTEVVSRDQWTRMQQHTGLETGTIVGPIFDRLHGGMDAVQAHATRMGDWWFGQLGRMRPDTANPVRYALEAPINSGLVPAWNAIDRMFALNRVMAPVPIGFAQGTEDHRAQIARGGRARLWNEPETGGEAYIPLARSKRGKSTDILARVAEEFGLGVVPRDLATFADGGLWRQMFGVVRNQFPAARLTSSYRRGDPGYHGTGRATDLAGPMGPINHWLANKFANSTQLIYTPGVNLFRGRPHTYNAATRADHFDHVHWALEHAGMLGGQQGSYTGSPGEAFDPRPAIEEKLADTRKLIAGIHTRFGTGNVPTAMTKLSNDAVDGAVNKALEILATASPGPGNGVERWRPVVHRALALVGQPRGHDNTTLRRMNQESGGNPRAINNWDINAVRGTPSKGLMQVIDPTFRSHRHPQTLNDIWDPLANMAASMRYAVSRYGSLPAAYNRAGGYDKGGEATRAGLMAKFTSLPERVLSPSNTAAFNDLVRMLVTDGFSDLVQKSVAGSLESAFSRARDAARTMDDTASRSAPVTTVDSSNHTELHFHGDLSFPNITNGDHAKRFLDNLESMTRK